MLERIKHMLIKEFTQLFRDPRMRPVVFIMPIMQLLVFSYAVNTDVTNIRLAVYDLDNTVVSRTLVSRFLDSGYFRDTARVGSDAEVRSLLDHERVQAILRINHGFQEDVEGGRTARLQLITDGTNSNSAAIILNYSQAIVNRFSDDWLRERLQRLRGVPPATPQVSLALRSWFNENLESRNYFVPGVIALIVTLVTLMLTSMAIVREKEIGTIEQIMVTPIRPVEFILGKTLPFAAIGFVDMIMVTVVGVTVFSIPFRGSLPLLVVATALYLLSTLGLGLLISTISRTQQQAVLSTFLFVMPAIMLSGFMFPIANMPRVIQWLTLLNPIRYFLEIIRGVFLKGVGLAILWPQMAALLLMGVVILTLSAKRFHKNLS